MTLMLSSPIHDALLDYVLHITTPEQFGQWIAATPDLDSALTKSQYLELVTPNLGTEEGAARSRAVATSILGLPERDPYENYQVELAARAMLAGILPITRGVEVLTALYHRGTNVEISGLFTALLEEIPHMTPSHFEDQHRGAVLNECRDLLRALQRVRGHGAAYYAAAPGS
jgi:hypothetical protein